MKTIIAVVVIVIVMWLLVQYRESETSAYEYVKEQTTEVVQNNPENPDSWKLELLKDEDAVKAAQAVIRKKELEAERGELQSQIEEKKKRVVEIEKELGTYWTDPKNVKALIRETFPEEPTVAIAVATCESGLKPTAYNPHNRDGSVDGGLWQINSVHDKRLKELGLDKYDPEDATKFARMLYEERGWRDWVCYTKKMLVMR